MKTLLENIILDKYYNKEIDVNLCFNLLEYLKTIPDNKAEELLEDIYIEMYLGEEEEVVEEGPIETFINKFPKFAGELRGLRQLPKYSAKNDFELLDLFKRSKNLF